jgi:putative flippase GtrA
MRTLILQILSFFYQPFKRIMPFQTFRYLACGGGNTAMDIVLFFLCYNFVLDKQNLDLYFFTLSPYIAAVFISFLISFPTGFLLNKYIVFTESNLRGRVQLVRYFLLVGACLLFNYVFMKFFVEVCHFYPTISKILTTIFVVCFSYITQKKFTFKVRV